LDREVLRRRLLLAQYLGASVSVEDAGARREGDLGIREEPVPDGWVGRTLQEADPFRAEGLFVLAVRRDEGGGLRQITPVPTDHVFQEGDRVVLLGAKARLDAAEARRPSPV